MRNVLEWKEYEEKACEAVAEGAVLLCNENNTLPLEDGACIALFGRMQNNYYKSGTGSGGLVNVDKVIGIKDGLIESKSVVLEENLLSFYEEWEKEHPFEEGLGWGTEPWSQLEATLPYELYEKVALSTDTAVVIIARTAGEDRDNVEKEGAYLLSREEEELLANVRKFFPRMIVLLNVGNIIDFSFVDKYSPEAVLLTWQGGMLGGRGIAELLLGKKNPSGKLADTVAYKLSDYSSDANFSDGLQDVYEEDVYVGYRFFSTFAPECVRYAFGYGLSYTSFDILTTETEVSAEQIIFRGTVKNTGDVSGKETVMIYVNPAQGLLGRPTRILAGFVKTALVSPGEETEYEITVPFESIAAYDDSGITGHAHCMLLEPGIYEWFVGNTVSDVVKVKETSLEEYRIFHQYADVCMPAQPFKRMKPCMENGEIKVEMCDVPVKTVSMETRMANDPINAEGPDYKTLPAFYEDAIKKYTLQDVEEGRITIDELVEDLSVDELCCLVRGEGMGSPRVTPGTASAFGGVSDGLLARKVPAICCSDGPSGMRLDCGRKAFSLPNGTLLACTFNEELNEELFELLGMEMRSNCVDLLLGPGINIHRHPLNGRNFEYFSEDPLLTGKIAAAQLRGLKKSGVTGVLKHFSANNRETKRRSMNSVVSARAMREIYLKGYEIAVKEAGADAIMTTYGALNGIWTAGHHELVTTVLHDEWKFEGIVMTDWWADINVEGKEQNGTDFATMIKAQNDLYMVCPEGSKNMSGDNLLSSLEDGSLRIGTLRRTARNVLSFALKTPAYKRITNRAAEVDVTVNAGPKQFIEDLTAVEYYELYDGLEIDLSKEDTSRDKNFVLPLNAMPGSVYEVEFVASSDLNTLAQLPVTLFFLGFPLHSLVFNGSEGREVSIRKEIGFRNRYGVYRLHFAQNGLQMKKIIFRYKGKSEEELFA